MNNSEIFITGANGQLGTALRAKYPGAKSADINEMDITQKDNVLNYNWSGIKYLLNAAAYTNVDGAETEEGRIAGDIVLAQATKHYILRTSWVIGEGKNFVRSILGLGQKGVEPGVVADQFGRPTFTAELVRAIDHLLKNNVEFGTYNISNGGEVASWADLARAVYEDAGFNLKVSDTTAAEYFAGKLAANRPVHSALDLSKIEATGFKPTDWRDDLKEYIKKEKENS
jgi:dTDP-4-dehydrorhamnose reductase